MGNFNYVASFLQMGKAKEAISENVIKGTTRVPGKQLVIVISRAKDTAGDQVQNAQTTGSKRVCDTTENGTEERCSKIPRMKEGEEQEENT